MSFFLPSIYLFYPADFFSFSVLGLNQLYFLFLFYLLLLRFLSNFGYKHPTTPTNRRLKSSTPFNLRLLPSNRTFHLLHTIDNSCIVTLIQQSLHNTLILVFIKGASTVDNNTIIFKQSEPIRK